jgi:hypothetical protein
MFKTIRGLLLAGVLSFVFFLVLPFRFVHTNIGCVNGLGSCNGYGALETTSHPWYWFGGYHIFFEPDTKDAYQRESNISQYRYGSQLDIVLFASVSTGFGIIVYLFACFINKKWFVHGG